jgi:hypothetical protein
MKSVASKRLAIWFVPLAEVVVLSCRTSTFLNWSNISRVFRTLSFVAIMAILHNKQHRGCSG